MKLMITTLCHKRFCQDVTNVLVASTVSKCFYDLGLSSLHGIQQIGLHMEDNLHKKGKCRILKRDYQLEHNHATV